MKATIEIAEDSEHVNVKVEFSPAVAPGSDGNIITHLAMVAVQAVNDELKRLNNDDGDDDGDDDE